MIKKKKKRRKKNAEMAIRKFINGRDIYQPQL